MRTLVVLVLAVLTGLGAAAAFFRAGCNRYTTSAAVDSRYVAGIEAAPDPDHLRFTDRTAESGVEFRYDNGQAAGHHAILESLGGGLGLFDYDGDGRCDLFARGAANTCPISKSSACFRPSIAIWATGSSPM